MQTEKSGDYLWIYPEADAELEDKFIKEFNFGPVTAKILINRGLKTSEDIHKFLYSKLPDLFDPYLFTDMDKAVDRICYAIDHEENILIYGDNDVDGMTGSALLTDFLKACGGYVFFYVPNRNALKKAVIEDAFEYAHTNNCKLIITVDCSIAETDLDKLQDRENIDIIITDHHEPTEKFQYTVATLNPKLVNSTYPNRDLVGVGVAFKLAHAIMNHRIATGQLPKKKIDLKSYLDLVALGTISDMGALRGENRILVQYGLRQLKKTKRIGLIKLFEVSEIDVSELNSMTIASKIAPRLNSLGRIADPRRGVEFLLVKDSVTAEIMAKELDLNNIERQKIERIMSEEIEAFIKEHNSLLKENGIVLCSNDWHPGIIPIITARISKEYNRPTILIAIDNHIGKGSMRTIPEFPLLPFLKKNADILINFGGHNAAAGLTIHEDNILELKNRFIQATNESLNTEDVQPKLFLDSPIHFNQLTFEFMETLKLLEPFGNENNPPLLYCHAKQAWPPKVINNLHLKLFLEQDDRFLEGIAISMAYKKKLLYQKGLTLNIAFTPQVNYYNNKASIQLIIKDFQLL